MNNHCMLCGQKRLQYLQAPQSVRCPLERGESTIIMRSEGRGVGSRKKGIGASLRARSCARSKSTSSTCRGKGIVDMAIVGIGIGFRVIGWNRGSINSKSRSSCRSTTSSPKSRSTSNRVNSRGRNYNDFSLRFRSIALSRANASSGLNRPHSYY